MHPRWIIFTVISVATATPRSGGAQQPPTLESVTNSTADATRGGRAQWFEFASSILKQTRQVSITLPESYSRSAPDRRYPVTVVLDGAWLGTKVAAVSDELSRNGQIPESIIVAIENTDDFQGRVHDLTPPGLSVSGSSENEGGDVFLDFIEQELLPAVDRQFRGGAPRTFIGTSSGGILATYAAATRSVYSAVIALDAPIHLGDNFLAKKLIARATTGAEPLRYVSYEARFGWLENEWKTLKTSAPASWQLHREQLPREGHESMQMLGAYLGLREVFSDFSRFVAPVAPTTSILPYYAKVSAALGANVLPPKRLLRNVVEDLLMEGRGAAARDAYNTLKAGYGAPDDSAKLLAEISDVERRPPPTETVEGLLATPFPTPDQARDYIGEWTGELWRNDAAPRRQQILRIKVVDGRVIGETVHPDAPTPEYRVQRWEHLRITPTGISWGYMNGMRPRGVILNEATRKGDTISGQTRFGGINFVGPHGPGPLEYFSFKRVK